MSHVWKRLIAKPSAVSLTFTDATVERLRRLQQEHSQTTRQLAKRRPVWEQVEGRKGPQAHIDRERLAPVILDLEAHDRRLSREIAQAEADIQANKAAAEDYERRANEDRPWLSALLAAMPSDDDIERALRESLQFDRMAIELLRRTGDRQFRRPMVDPYRALHEALTERLHAVERARSLRSSMALRDKTAAS